MSVSKRKVFMTFGNLSQHAVFEMLSVFLRYRLTYSSIAILSTILMLIGRMRGSGCLIAVLGHRWLVAPEAVAVRFTRA